MTDRPPDHAAHAREVLAGTRYAVLGTTDDDGHPWVTPVWFAPDGLERLYWLSYPDARHSQLIENRPQIALTVFDSHAVPNQGSAFYAVARAERCPHDRLAAGLVVLNRRARTDGIGELTREGITGASRLRLYLATIEESWVLDPDADTDRRVQLPRRGIEAPES